MSGNDVQAARTTQKVGEVAPEQSGDEAGERRHRKERGTRTQRRRKGTETNDIESTGGNVLST